jgi:ribonuclease P protein component
MISRSHRFHGHGSLRYVYQHGQVVRGPLTSLKYSPNPKRKSYRLAVVVSKKVSKSAVVRNRIRRRLYEQFRLQSAAFTSPCDMVVTVFHEQVATMPAAELSRLVAAQLRQAHITTGKSSGEHDKI